MILVSRRGRERKRSERGKKKRFPQPDSSAVSITSHYLPSGGGWGGGKEAVVGFWLYHNKNSPDPP